VTVVVRDAAANDAARIAEIARASWTDTYRDIFDAAFIEEFLATHYRVEDLANGAARAAEADDRHFLVAERDGDVVAFAQYAVGPRGPQLFRIYADPPHYGIGAGHALLEELHRRLAGRVEGYVLDVHSRNERGLAFYRRHGFVVVGGGETPDCDLTLRRDLTAKS
jgi:GNAT superfamily N-acetyltransferase